MKNKSIKLINTLGVVAIVGAGQATAFNACEPDHTSDMGHSMRMDYMANSPAMFSARGSETKQITIGGFVEFGYQNVWAEYKGDTKTKVKTPHYNNFLLEHLRLLVDAEIGGGWSALMNVDFAKAADGNLYQFTNVQINSDEANYYDCSCSCCSVNLDKAYIQKVYGDHKIRFGYQKVDFGVEEVTTDPSLKPITRGTTTNYFTNLGTNGFAGRHLGVFLSGDFTFMCDYNLHYSAALVNGYQGDCGISSNKRGPTSSPVTSFDNNELGVFGGLAYAFMAQNVDLTVGINAGYQAEGNSEPTGNTKEAYVFNPYALAQVGNFSLMGELFYGTLDSGAVTSTNDAHPWGFSLVPSMMLNEQWEVVARVAYLDTDLSGTTMIKAFGCLPDCKAQSNGAQRNIAGGILYNKAYSWYVGVNYYLMNKAVKASVGYDGARFKDSRGTKAGGADNVFCGPDAHASAVRANLQLLF